MHTPYSGHWSICCEETCLVKPGEQQDNIVHMYCRGVSLMTNQSCAEIWLHWLAGHQCNWSIKEIGHSLEVSFNKIICHLARRLLIHPLVNILRGGMSWIQYCFVPQKGANSYLQQVSSMVRAKWVQESLYQTFINGYHMSTMLGTELDQAWGILPAHLN